MVTMPQDYRWASHRYYVQAKGAPSWLTTKEAVEQIGGRQAFHEFVLSGNEESLKQYYEAQRQSPILGSEEFIERVRPPGAAVGRGDARDKRRGGQPGAADAVRGRVGAYKRA